MTQDEAQEQMFTLRDEQTLVDKQIYELESRMKEIFRRKRLLLDEFPTLHFRRPREEK